ncbi:MAG TPA: hypothetical protein VGW38_27305 [Chloroflexota bacterium]|nr:hypothetical protein [Chloroflexota bacterium]
MKSMTQRTRGWQQFTIGIIAYSITVILEAYLLEPETLSPVLGVLFALLPMGFAICGMLGWLEAVRGYDEMQQKIYSEAGLLSLGVTAAVTFTYGFFEIYLHAPKLSMFFVWPVIAASYMVFVPLVKRRYR